MSEVFRLPAVEGKKQIDWSITPLKSK